MALKNAIFLTVFFVSVKIANAQYYSHDSIDASKTSAIGSLVLQDFSAKVLDDKVKLSWTTSSEKNNKEFFIYRSIDERNWYVVVNLPGKINSVTSKNYEAIDKSASGGINHYKLAWFDTERIGAALKVVKVDLEDKSQEIKVIPNNISSTLKLESAEPIYSMEIELTDMLERKFYAPFVTDSSHEITIITGPLAPGAYFLKCFLNKKRHAVKKVIII